MLETIDLECTRGERLLFSGLALHVGPGVCLHVAGENGAGKTSLLRILCGLLSPTAGHVQFGGEDIRKLREDFWQLLAYVGHLNGVKDDLTALENVRFAASLAGHSTEETGALQALGAVGLAGFEFSQARFLSQGQRRRIALARLFLAREARLWILDEPFTSLDHAGGDVMQTLLAEHLAAGGAVVLTSHQPLTLPGGPPRLVRLDGT